MVPNSTACEQTGLDKWLSGYLTKLVESGLGSLDICIIVVAVTCVIGQVSIIFSFLLSKT